MSTPNYPESLDAALLELQRDLPDVIKAESAEVTGMSKNGKPFTYTYNYADLSAVEAALMPKMTALGLIYVTKPNRVDGVMVLEYSLRHVPSKQREDGIYDLPKGSPQDVGSAITYGRRYVLLCLTGLAPKKDDDDATKAEHAYRERAAQRHEEQQRTDEEVKAELAEWRRKAYEAGDVETFESIARAATGSPLQGEARGVLRAMFATRRAELQASEK